MLSVHSIRNLLPEEALGCTDSSKSEGFFIFMAQFYTTIIHPVRKAFHLSCNEYCVLDTILRMQNNDAHWCYMSRETMADDLDLSKQSILNIIKGLILKGLVIKHPQTSHLRCAPIFKDQIDNYKNFGLAEDQFTIGKESLPEGSKKFTSDGKESLPNNKTNNKNTFIKPTAELVREYAKSIDFELDADYFIDFNESRGWTIGKYPMKDWKATIRTWKRNQSVYKNNNTTTETPKIKLR